MGSKATSDRKSASRSGEHKEANLGQKDAKQQKKSEAELEHMGDGSSKQGEGSRSS
jgi:hypothetical protein